MMRLNIDYKKSFSLTHSSDKNGLWPVEWLCDKSRSNQKREVYLSYDANLCPLPPINEWSKGAREEMCKMIAERFKDSGKEIYLDGFFLDLETGRLTGKKLSK